MRTFNALAFCSMALMACSSTPESTTGGGGDATTSSTGGGGDGGVGGEGGAGGAGGEGGSTELPLCDGDLSGEGVSLVSVPAMACGNKSATLVGAVDGWVIFRITPTGHRTRTTQVRLSAEHNPALGCYLGTTVEHSFAWTTGTTVPSGQWKLWTQAFDVPGEGNHDVTLTLPNPEVREADESVFVAVQRPSGFCPFVCESTDPTYHVISAPPDLIGEWKTLPFVPTYEALSEIVEPCAKWTGSAAGECAWDSMVGAILPPTGSPTTGFISVRPVVTGPAKVVGISASFYGLLGLGEMVSIPPDPELVYFFAPTGEDVPKITGEDLTILATSPLLDDGPRSKLALSDVELNVPNGMTLFAGSWQYAYEDGTSTAASTCGGAGLLGQVSSDPTKSVSFVGSAGPTVGVFLAE